AMKRQGRADGQFYSLPAEYRQCARKAQANRADICIRRGSELDGTATKYLRFRAELNMNLETDDRFVFGQDILGEDGRHISIVRSERMVAHDSSCWRAVHWSLPTEALYVKQICFSFASAASLLLRHASRPCWARTRPPRATCSSGSCSKRASAARSPAVC